MEVEGQFDEEELGSESVFVRGAQLHPLIRAQ